MPKLGDYLKSMPPMERCFTLAPRDPATPAEPACSLCRDTGLWTGYLETKDGQRLLYANKPCPKPGCKAAPIARARQEQEVVDKLFGEAAIPPLYERAELADFAPGLAEKVKAALREGRGLLLSGPVGIGKSHLLAGALKLLVREQQSALFIGLPRLLTVIRDTFRVRRASKFSEPGEDCPTERDLLDAAAMVGWLGLDDLGVEIGTGWVQQEVYQLVNARYLEGRTPSGGWKRPIIATTNLTTQVLADDDHLGPRTVSRLREMCQVVTLAGADRRVSPNGRRP